MGSSKNKSSFRIADILHHQQNDHESQQIIRSPVSYPVKNSVEVNSNVSRSSRSKSPLGEIPSDLPMPHKPTAMYPNLADLQKASFPLSFPLGMHPPFYPAYLDYAFNKGE